MRKPDRKRTLGVLVPGFPSACGSCLDARGIDEKELVTGLYRSSMAQMTEWTLWTSRVLAF